MVFCGEVETGRSSLTGSLTATTATATKTSLENKHLGQVDYFVIYLLLLPRLPYRRQSTLQMDW